MVLQNLIFFNYKVKRYAVNKHNWYLELVHKFYFAHKNEDNDINDFKDPP